MADRLASAFVLAVMCLFCLVLWVVVPAGGIWLGGRIGGSFASQLIFALLSVLVGMLATATVLGWLNELYLRTTGGAVVVVEGVTFRRRGPMEAVLVGSLGPLVLALVIWLALGRPEIL